MKRMAEVCVHCGSTEELSEWEFGQETLIYCEMCLDEVEITRSDDGSMHMWFPSE